MSVLSVIGQILTLVGALGLFLFGMKLMSEALQKVAGNKMRNILAAMTSNRLKGIFTGFLVTSTIQSSSATTVMVVSFVNAGLLSLVGAIGVIMGANIGTTVTAWIISILGFKISLSFLSLPLIGISFPFFFSKNNLRKSWGEFMIGFAILFIGLQFLKEAVPDIKSNPAMFEFLSNYTDSGFMSILIFVVIGTIFTIIIQSSSATMALTLVLCYNGLIPFELAAAMVLGENIGTTITANLAAVVANVSAKRAARAHFIFNIFGVIWILAIFHPFLNGINWIMERYHGFSILSSEMTLDGFSNIKQILPVALALFHTSFNILNSLILVGFTDKIAKIATKAVPSVDDEDEEFRLKYIKTGLLSTSELSIIQARKEIAVFGTRVEKMFKNIPILLTDLKPKKYDKLLRKVSKHEQITDNMEEEIASYISSISEGELSHQSSLRIRAMLKIIDDLESIGDVCYQMSKTIDNKNRLKIMFNDEQVEDLNLIFEKVKESLTVMNQNLETDTKLIDIKKAIQIENSINEMRDQLRQKNVEDLKEKKYKYKVGSFYSDIFSMSEKIGDYAINITEALVEYKKGKK